MLTEWNWDDAKEVWQEEAFKAGEIKGRREGRQSGLIEGRQSGLRDGEIKGLLQAYKEMGFSLDVAIEKIAEKLDLTSEEVSQKAALYW